MKRETVQRYRREAKRLRRLATRKAAIGPAYLGSAMDLVWEAMRLEERVALRGTGRASSPGAAEGGEK